jgi:hypothetical protein
MPSRERDPRTEILHVRLTEQERNRLRRAARAEYADQSAWARAALLKALDAWEAIHGAPPASPW